MAPLQSSEANQSVLWVGSLSEKLNEEDVCSFFSRFGPVVRAKLNKATEGTDQYAHVHFKNESDASAALFELNGVQWPGMTGSRPFKIQHSTSGKALPFKGARAGAGRSASPIRVPSPARAATPAKGNAIWIGSLVLEVTKDDLMGALSEYGAVTGLQLHTSLSGSSQYATATFEREAAAAAAVEDLDGYEGLWLSGSHPLKAAFLVESKIGRSKPGATPGLKREGEGGGEAGQEVKEIRGHYIVHSPPCRLLWVGNLGLQATTAATKALFSKHGDVLAVEVVRPMNFLCQYAFVTMKTTEQAERAKQALDGKTDPRVGWAGEKPLKVRYAQPNRERGAAGAAMAEEQQEAEGPWDDVEVTPEELEGASRHLWVGNLRTAPQSSDLVRVFSQFGKIERARAVEGKLFGFVNFFEKQAAARALKALHGRTVPSLTGQGRTLMVEYHNPEDASDTNPAQGPKRAVGASELTKAAPATATVAASGTKARQPSSAARGPDQQQEQPAQPWNAGHQPMQAPPTTKEPSQPLPAGQALHPAHAELYAELAQRAQQPPSQEQEDAEQEALLHLMGGGPSAAGGSAGTHAALHANGGPENWPPLPPQQQQQHSQQQPPPPPQQQHPQHPPHLTGAGPPLAGPWQGPPTTIPPTHGPPVLPGPGLSPPLHLPPPGMPAPSPTADMPPHVMPRPLQPQLHLPPPPQAPAAPAAGLATQSPEAPESCNYCGVNELSHPATVLQQCTGCQAVSYCGASHQLADWNARHHRDCGRLAALGSALRSQPACIALLRASLEQPWGAEAGLVRRLLHACSLEDA